VSVESHTGHDLETYKQQAREVVRKLADGRAPARMSIESGVYLFNYIIEDGVCFLTLCDRAYPKKLAFAFLVDVHKAFVEELQHEHGAAWGTAVATASRAFQFLRFDRVLHRLKRDYADPSSRQNKSKLEEELADIRSIMRKNISEVLERGERLDEVSKISSKLVEDSKKFKWGAKKLNLLDAWKKYAPFVIVLLVVIVVLWWRFR